MFILVVSEYGPNKTGWTLPADLSICHQIPILLLLLLSFLCRWHQDQMWAAVPFSLLCRLSRQPFQDLVLQLLPSWSFCSLAIETPQLQSIPRAIPTCSVKQCSLLTREGSLLYSWTSWHRIWDFPMLNCTVFYKLA